MEESIQKMAISRSSRPVGRKAFFQPCRPNQSASPFRMWLCRCRSRQFLPCSHAEQQSCCCTGVNSCRRFFAWPTETLLLPHAPEQSRFYLPLLKLSRFFDAAADASAAIPFSTISIAKTIVCLGEVRLKFNGLLIFNDGLVHSASLGKAIAKIVMDLREIRFDFHRLLIF